MLAEFSSLQHCRQSRNAEADAWSDFQEKLFRNNFSLIRFSCCCLFQQLSIIWFSKLWVTAPAAESCPHFPRWALVSETGRSEPENCGQLEAAKLIRINFWPLAKREALSFEKSGSNPCWRNFPLFSIAGRAGMLKLMSDLIFKKSCSGTTFFRLDFLNYEKKTTIKQSIGSKKRPRRKRPLLFKSQLFCI